MMMNILLPTDFSVNAWNALNYAQSLFKNKKVTFYFLHIKPPKTTPYEEDVITLPQVQTYPTVTKLKKLLADVKTHSSNKKHRFYASVEEGIFVETLRKKVIEEHIDYIVMGTKGIANIKEATVGSHTTEVITKVKCPVLIIPENARYKTPKEIAFPTDFNIFYKHKVIETLHSITDLNQSSLSVLYVSKKSEALSEVQENNKNYLKEHLNGLAYSFNFAVNQTLEEAIEAYVVSKDINMIAMMAKNLNFFQHILFHPVARKLSYHTDIPFLVLHE